jgi:trigger factor
MLPDALFQEQAERSVKLGVLVAKIIEQSKLTVDQDRVTTMITEMSESYEDPTEVIEHYSNDKQQRAQIEAVVLEDQVVDHILAGASVSDIAVSYQDLLAAQQAANQRG